ncbi:hypothetical protein Y032_0444g1565 [Ancylostoma ceylanicum]|uniref:PAN domain protein n=1 Tax=Ancylostoma ceylanicum TaxID=53326 RepID=A0A016WZ70_9BILA|nr:hypothetical protein Y032_0444g1565 [Ancylostoma ceylanicum]
MGEENVFNWLVLYLLLSNVKSIKSCTFSKINEEFGASFKFQILLENEEVCILACYEEVDCVYVDYVGNLCSIYAGGRSRHTPTGTAFELDRKLLSPSCSRRVEVGQLVTFQKYPAPSISQGSCAGNPSTPTTTISIYRNSGARFLTNIPNPTLPAGAAVARRILLAKEPQSNCKPLPVFTRANHRRLFFGSIYNVTGYYFLDGYAFEDYCECDDGACCGITALREVSYPDSSYNYQLQANPSQFTEVDQPFFVVSFEIA